MDFKRVAGSAITIVLALAGNSGLAFAAEKEDVIAAVHRYLDNLDQPERRSRNPSLLQLL